MGKKPRGHIWEWSQGPGACEEAWPFGHCNIPSSVRGRRTQTRGPFTHLLDPPFTPPRPADPHSAPAVSPHPTPSSAKGTPGGAVLCHYQSVPRTTCGHVLAPGARSERSATAAHLLHRRATPRPTAGLRTPSRRSDCSNSPYPFASLAPAKPGADCEPRDGPRESCSPFLSLSQRDPRTPGPRRRRRRRELRSLGSPARTLRAAPSV